MFAAQSSGHVVGGLIAELAQPVGHAAGVLAGLLRTTGRIPAEIVAAVDRTFSDSASNLEGAMLWFAGATALIGLVPWIKVASRNRFPAPRGINAAAALAFDLVEAALIVAVATGAAVALSPLGGEGSFAIALIWALVRFRLGLLMVDVLLRADESDLRLLLIDDSSARRVRRWIGSSFAVGIGFIAVVPVLLNNGMPLPEARAAALFSGTAACMLALFAILSLSRALQFSRMNVVAAGGVLLLVWLAWLAGVTSLRFEFYHAVMQYIRLAWGVTAIMLIVGRAEMASIGANGLDAERHRRLRLMLGAARRSLMVAGGAAAIAMAGPLGLFALLIDPDRSDLLARAMSIAAITLGAGYAAFEALGTWTRIRFPVERPAANESDEDVKEGSRLDTVLPIVAGALFFGTIVIAVLLALGELGINTGPLLAGAGVFGLALSFGSQAIVRDIISGLFFMSDDAFRAGEYIAVGAFKGRVEKISLRSMRLRHHNGQFHTLPYGQIGAVTNFSRDWATIKFNLKLARSTDVEHVRKVTKKVGLSLMDDPDIGGEFLLPLKMQGIAEVQESALSLRFKFTAKPTKPSYVHRQALKHLYEAFAREQIAFATHSVVVQPAPGSSDIKPNASNGAAAAHPSASAPA